ncbi:hypothetical protein GJV07_02065 [Enterobacteriaceae bacterium RIT711]|nr:hypothetical protein [Enterobacteriaceae bacterium RIT711]
MTNPIIFGGTRTIDFYDTTTSIQSLPVGTTASSGALCPQTGVWKCQSYQVVVGVNKGTVMPQYQSRDVDWELTEYSLADLNQSGQ